MHPKQTFRMNGQENIFLIIIKINCYRIHYHCLVHLLHTFFESNCISNESFWLIQFKWLLCEDARFLLLFYFGGGEKNPIALLSSTFSKHKNPMNSGIMEYTALAFLWYFMWAYLPQLGWVHCSSKLMILSMYLASQIQFSFEY